MIETVQDQATPGEGDVSPSAARMRKARERRKDGVRVVRVELSDADILSLVDAGVLEPSCDTPEAVSAAIRQLIAGGTAKPSDDPLSEPQEHVAQQDLPTRSAEIAPAAEIARPAWRAPCVTLERDMDASELRELIAHSAKQYRTSLIQARMIEITPDQYDGLSADLRRHFMPVKSC
jgi:hypothetical protein